jgi:biotin carboxylase
MTVTKLIVVNRGEIAVRFLRAVANLTIPHFTVETEERLLIKVQGHVTEIHRTLEMTPEFTSKVQGVFRD